jgi:hypothetical protein
VARCDIFIGYYRDSAAAPALALHHHLCRYFPRERIYVDRRGIRADNAGPNNLSDEHFRQSKVILYMITDDGTDMPTAPARPSADAASHARFLKELSLVSGKRFIPVLYGGAAVPPEFAMYDSFSLSGMEDQLQIAELVRLIGEVTAEPKLEGDTSAHPSPVEKDLPSSLAAPIAEPVTRTMGPAFLDHAPPKNLIAEPGVLRFADNGPKSEDYDTITLLQREAESLWLAGDFIKASILQEMALDAYCRMLGKERPETLAALCNLAEMFWALGNLAEAKALHQQVLDIRRDVLGDRHPDTTAAAWNLFLTLTQISDHAAAGHVIQQYLNWLQDSAPEALSPEQQRIRDMLRQFFS